MENTETTDNSISTEQLLSVITDIVQNIFNTLFSSIDNTIYNLLDNIVILTSSNVINENIKQIFFSDNFNLLILVNILVGFLFIYKITKIISSYYTNQETEFILLYILKAIFIIIFANSCLFICESLINFNYLITEFLLQLGEHLFNSKISFLNFANDINTYVSNNNTTNIFSIDGIIKSIITFGSISLLISYIIRFILIKVLILCSPFFIICLLQENLQQYFFSWLKYFFVLLITQNFIIIVLYIPHILSLENTTYSKLLIIGSILLLFKLNSYIQEIIGGFNFSKSSNISSSIFKSIGKGGN